MVLWERFKYIYYHQIRRDLDFGFSFARVRKQGSNYPFYHENTPKRLIIFG